MLQPLDMHAHIGPGIAPAELDRLGACVLAVTRSLAEFNEVAQRSDRSVAWGIGCHPGLARALRIFSLDEFRAGLATTAFVGEVGLDGTAKGSLATQRAVFDDVVSALIETPRIVSVHSYRATGAVLDTLKQHQPRGVVLHWWLGDEEATRCAVDLGAFFSVNAAQVDKWPALRVVPQDRLLPETDHPFGDRRAPAPRQPGNVSSVERRLAEAFGMTPSEVRSLVWRNLAQLVNELRLHDLLPHQFQVQLLAA